MKRIKLPCSIKKLRAHLQRGGVIAYPTESCYGLGCLPNNLKGLKTVLRLKKRPQHKGLITIANHIKQLQPLLKPLGNCDVIYLKKQWPAAKTFLLESNNKILSQLRGKRRYQLAVRIPDHIIARMLSKKLNSALVSTSCNRAKQRPCKTQREVYRQFGKKIYIVGGKIGNRKCPSEIIDYQNNIKLR